MTECGKPFFQVQDESKKFDKYSCELKKPIKVTREIIKNNIDDITDDRSNRVWSRKKELEFKKNRLQSKKNSRGLVASSAYVDCSLSTFIYKFVNNKTT
jgi:hypothetical protein